MVLQKTPYTFDVSVWELFWANWYGATIVFAKPGEHKNNQYLCELIREKKSFNNSFCSSMLKVYLSYICEDKALDLQPLRYVFAVERS